MAAKRPNHAREIVAAFNRDDTHLLAIAAKAYAAMIEAHDARHPDPEARADAETLRRLAEDMLNANGARQYIEEGS